MTQRTTTIAFLTLLGLAAGLGLAFSGEAGSPHPVPLPHPLSVPIYVSDFELPALPSTRVAGTTAAGSPKNTDAAARPSDAPLMVYDESDAAVVRASKLVRFFSATMIKSLQKAGFTAARQTGALPGSGILLRGVFSEPDAQNQIRRALLGAATPSPKFLLYVGTFNLGRPDQPLYQMAPVQPGQANYGPVITLNTYVPLAKYELDKNPTEEQVQKICAQAAANLTTLVNANPEAFGE